MGIPAAAIQHTQRQTQTQVQGINVLPWPAGRPLSDALAMDKAAFNAPVSGGHQACNPSHHVIIEPTGASE